MATTGFRKLLALFASAAVVPAFADDGLRVSPDTVAWPRWQARMGVAAPQAGVAPVAVNPSAARSSVLLLGDYYFTGPGFGAGKVGGGLRATSGVLFGSRTGGLGTAALGSAPGLSLNAAPGESVADGGTVPYLGVGYTGVSVRGGWGFSADVGLMATGGGLRLARTPAIGQSLDDQVRDVRLTPVLQLGVSYSF